MGDVEGVAYTEYSRGRYGHRLLFHLSDGGVQALQYAALINPKWSSDGSIELDYVGHKVTIEGRNLQPLYFAIANDMAAEIYEDHSLRDTLPRDPEERKRARAKPYVKKIMIAEV